MVWQHSPYAVPLVFVALILVSFAIYAWQYRVNRATTLFIIFIAAVAILLLAFAGEYSSADLRSQMMWARAAYVSTFLPGIWLLFVLSYTRRIQHLPPLLLAMVFLVPAINSVLVWTNHVHHLIWADVSSYAIGPLMYFQRTYGEAAILGQVVETLTGLLAMVLLGIELRRGTPTYRRQIALLFVAGLLPLVAYLLNAVGFNPFPPLRLVAIGFALSCIPIGYSLFRFQLLDILPAAYDLIVTSMKDAVLVVNTRQRIVYANPSAVHLIERPNSLLVGQTVEEAFSGAPQIVDHLLELYDSSTEVTLRAGPDQVVCELVVSPLRSRNGRLAGRVVVFHDITRRKQAELSAERTAERLAERNRMLDTYSHTVAHDLKSPLHIVLGYVDLLKMEMPPDASPQAKSFLRLISEAAINMAQMIDNLLLLARLDDIQTVIQKVDVQPVVVASVNNLKESIRSRDIDIQIGEPLPPVMGHAPWLGHVFSNLLGNAIKYIGKDNESPRITIRGTVHEGIARFEVEDNGLGISSDDQGALFDKFSRFHKAEAPGSGLGLTIVDMIIHRLGGKLGVTSQPGLGSTFWFELPAAPPVEAREVEDTPRAEEVLSAD